MMRPRTNIQSWSSSLFRRTVTGSGALASAFTLIEMLVVLVIIGILAALALPHIRGNLESRAIDAASRQVLEDLSFARQKAISQRSTVAVVFIPKDVIGLNYNSPIFGNDERDAVKRLQSGAYTEYAIYAFRRVGEQPGQRSSGYITEWKILPEKTFFASNQFDFGTLRRDKFPFPFSSSVNSADLPYIAFDSEGRSIEVKSPLTGGGIPGEDVDLEIARGAILFVRKADGAIDDTSFQMQEIPPFNATQNVVHVDALTGRAKWIKAELK
jgi:prepilin-type N-terminal cleavage/methylation domain-containing protein